MDALLVDLQVPGQDGAVGVGHLGGSPDPHVPVGGVVARHQASGLHGIGGVAVCAELLPADVLRLAESGLDVAHADLGRARQVAVVDRVHQHRVLQRFINGGDGGQRLVVNLDQVQGVLGDIPAPGHHHSHRLTRMPDGVAGERPLEVIVQPRQGKHAHGDGLE